MLQRSYTVLAPLYDAVVTLPTRTMRQRSLAQLVFADKTVLLCGIGTGLDRPFLPPGGYYTGIDLTWAMLTRAQKRSVPQQVMRLQQGDVLQLPYRDHSFDIVIMHFILAVVAKPQQALNEASRVLKPAGELTILDKFLKPGQPAPLRRFMNPLISRFITRTDVVFETLTHPHLNIIHDQAALMNGWFRHILLRKQP